jgi:hypothetical protein
MLQNSLPNGQKRTQGMCISGTAVEAKRVKLLILVVLAGPACTLNKVGERSLRLSPATSLKTTILN